MFLKRITFLAFFATVFSAASAQKLDATFDLVRFKANDKQSMVELYCSVNGNSVIYKKVQGGFQASVALEVQASDSVGIRHFDKLLMKSPIVTDTSVFQQAFNLQKRIFLPNGNYKFAIKAKDANSSQPADNIDLPMPVGYKNNAVQLSDIQLIDSYSKSSEKNDYTKNGYKLVSYVSNFYPKGLNTLKFYTEIYNAESVLGKDKPMVVYYRIVPNRDNFAKLTIAGQKVMKAAPANVLLHELDITTLASGNYDIMVEVRDENNKVVATQRRNIQRHNPLTVNEEVAMNTVVPKSDSVLPAAFANLDSTKYDLYLLSLRPISNAMEGSFIEKVVKNGSNFQKKSYLYSFWKKRDSENTERAWLEYKKRIEDVEKSFANQTFHGYETDQGRVYLQYGPPSKITDERTDVYRTSPNTDTRPYQIWQYYTMPDDQRNKMFAFVQMNLGNSFSLVHSTARGERTNLAWRSLARQRYKGASDGSSDNDSGADREYDNEGNEIRARSQRMPQNR